MMETCILVCLIWLFIQCQGNTYFHYLTDENALTLSCDTCKWQVDTDFDQSVDCNLSNSSDACEQGCYSMGEELCKQIEEHKSDHCQITVRKGFFACVSAFDTRTIVPFETPPHHVDSFLVVPEMFSKQMTNITVRVSEGESVTLTCDVMETNLFLFERHTLLWIRSSVDKSSSCASSTQLQRPGTHNLTIASASQADSGQYLCAVQTEKIRMWRIISNITVTVDKSAEVDTYLFHVCVAGALIVMGVTAIVVVEFRRKMTSELEVTRS
ncbi:uncharacterized protein LOC143132197 isoform X1 [Alosa pseudoharengus]|uniref:uncharacterized protein LOC143132197 isoform X1 n=1 Tax=Alosa pseudoharengus TaxID=34774 RepID=UPI003F8A3C88